MDEFNVSAIRSAVRLEADLRRHIDILEQQLIASERKEEKLEQDVVLATEERIQLKDAIDKKDQENLDFKQRIDILEQKLVASERQKEQLEQHVASLTEDITGLKEEKIQMNNTMDKNNRENQDLKRRINILEKKLNASVEQEEQLEQHVTSLTEDVTSLTEEKIQMTNDMDEKDQEIEDLKRRVKTLKFKRSQDPALLADLPRARSKQEEVRLVEVCSEGKTFMIPIRGQEKYSKKRLQVIKSAFGRGCDTGNYAVVRHPNVRYNFHLVREGLSNKAKAVTLTREINNQERKFSAYSLQQLNSFELKKILKDANPNRALEGEPENGQSTIPQCFQRMMENRQ